MDSWTSSPNLSEPQFPHIETGDNKTDLKVLQKLNEVMNIKYSEWYLAPRPLGKLELLFVLSFENHKLHILMNIIIISLWSSSKSLDGYYLVPFPLIGPH